jgi:hypothetical protein
MSMFITGGTSSIGRVLVKQLSQDGLPLRLLVRKNSDRRGLDLPNVEFIEGEVNDAGTVRKGMQGCDQVTHLAAIVAYNVPEAEWWRVNRDGSQVVLQAAYDLQVESCSGPLFLSWVTRPGEIMKPGLSLPATSVCTRNQSLPIRSPASLPQGFRSDRYPTLLRLPCF